MEKPTFQKFRSALYASDYNQVIEINLEYMSEGVITISHWLLSKNSIKVPAGAVKCSEREFMGMYALAMVRLQDAISL